MRYHFVGIAGTGMSGLSRLMRASGHEVSGSDRCLDRGEQPVLRGVLRNEGILLFPQDGSGALPGIEMVISSAVEPDNPDIVQAKRRGLTITKRAALLANVFNKAIGIAVAGTSGKSTVAALIAWALRRLGKDPVYCGGAPFVGDGPSAMRYGSGPFFCVEADESDGSLVEFKPKIAVLTNISKDHQDVHALRPLFERFLSQTEKALVLNADCSHVREISVPDIPVHWFGTRPDQFAVRVTSSGMQGSDLLWEGMRVHVPLPGAHNVSNALAALTALHAAGISFKESAHALQSFPGVHRRMERVARAREVEIYDDYAHNPEKVAAALQTLQAHFARVAVVFQLHGYGPARFLREGFEEVFATHLRVADALYMPKIYDAGGTAERSIRASDIAEGIRGRAARGVVHAIDDWDALIETLGRNARDFDAICVMGARDPLLPARCRQIAETLSAPTCP